MVAITASTEVARSAQDVFAYATDPSRFHEWQKGVVDGRHDASHEMTVGDRCVTVRRIGFANRPVTSEITELDAPRRWVVRGIDGPIRARVEVDVEAIADRHSRLTITLDFEGRGVGRVLVATAVVPQARREMPVNLALLRRRLEAAGR